MNSIRALLTSIVAALAAAGLASHLFLGLAFAQGATGGVVGKQNKSIGGTEESAASRAKPSHPVAATPNVSSQIEGMWDWQCRCANSKSYSGQFHFIDAGGGQFRGQLLQAGFSPGEISNGIVRGNRLSFKMTRTTVAVRTEFYTASIGTNGNMMGSISTETDGACSFTATKH